MSPELAMAPETRFLMSMLTDSPGDLNVNGKFVSRSAVVPSPSKAHTRLSIIQSNYIAIIIYNEIYIPLLYCNSTLQ